MLLKGHVADCIDLRYKRGSFFGRTGTGTNRTFRDGVDDEDWKHRVWLVPGIYERLVAIDLARDSSTLGHPAGGPLQIVQTARATNRGASTAAETPPRPSRIALPLEQGRRPRSGDRWAPRGANSRSSSTHPDTPSANVINAVQQPKSFVPQCGAPDGDPALAGCRAATTDPAHCAAVAGSR